MIRFLIFFLFVVVNSYAQNIKPKLYSFESNGYLGLVNSEMEIIAEPIYDGLTIDYFQSNIIYSKDGKRGVLDSTGNNLGINREEVLIHTNSPKYLIHHISDGYNHDLNSYGVIDLNGNEIIEPIYGRNILFFIKSNLFVLEQNGNKAFFTKGGKRITEFKYRQIQNFYNSSLFLMRDSKTFNYGYLNKKGKEVIEPKFNKAYNFVNKYAVAGIDEKLGFINKKGKFVVDPVFQEVFYHINPLTLYEKFFNGRTYLVPKKKFYYVKKDNKMGVLDENLKTIVPVEYDEVGTFTEGLLCVKKNGKYGYVDEKGIVIIPIVYDNADYFSEGLAPVVRNDNWGFINAKNQVIIDFKFKGVVRPFSEGLAIYRKNLWSTSKKHSESDKCGYINKKGEIVIEPIYKDVSQFKNGVAEVYGKKNKFLINRQHEKFVLEGVVEGIREVRED